LFIFVIHHFTPARFIPHSRQRARALEAVHRAGGVTITQRPRGIVSSRAALAEPSSRARATVSAHGDGDA